MSHKIKTDSTPRKGADICYSEDDGGWYAQLFVHDATGIHELSCSDSHPSQQQAQAWAIQNGAEPGMIFIIGTP
ncbi:MAG TPA: hypothetical protein VFL54_09070 [Gammaproteobacteria bacterium]|nr:hypothetical protein [Gammaproteobacteria bacterium]